MIQDDIKVFIEDLCSKIPFGVMCKIYRVDDEGVGWRNAKCTGFYINDNVYEFYFDNVVAVDNVAKIRMYLRPLSSMTDFEMEELCYKFNMSNVDFNEFKQMFNDYININKLLIKLNSSWGLIEWLNRHHFDFQQMIRRGFALEAPADMYNE